MREKKYPEVAKRIEAYIREKEIPEGERLISEKKLAEWFQVNHLTIRKALEILEEKKLIHKIPCKGNFIGRKPRGRGDSNLIGVIFPENDPFFYEVLVAFEAKLDQFNLSPVVRFSYWSHEREKKILADFLRSKVAGIIAVPNKACAEDYRELDIPIVFFDSLLESLPIPYVINDDYQGARMAVRHLISLGHQKIAYIGGLGDHTAIQRYAGYRDELKEEAISVKQAWCLQREYSRQWGYSAAEQLSRSSEHPTAVFCGSDTIASGFLKYLKNNDIPCPEMVSVIGFSNSRLSEDIGLSTLEQQTDEIVNSIWRNLQLLMAGKTPSPATIIPTKLVIRTTTGGEGG